MTKLKDGWHDLPAPDYHAMPAMSSGAIKELTRSPAHCHYYMHDAEYTPPTTAQILGSAFHSYALEYHRDKIATLPDGIDRRTKVGKAAYAEFTETNKGKTIINAEQFAQLQGMMDAIKAHPAASALLSIKGQLREASGLLKAHPDHGFACKIRPDILCRSNALIIDLKSTQSASPEDFPRQIANFQYHLQAAYYCRIAELLDGNHYRFVIIAVEKAPPYGVMCYEIDAIWQAAARIEPLLAQYAECIELDNYPAYNQEIVNPDMPNWMK